MAVTPDKPGFAAAQAQLRDYFGEDVTFHFEAVRTWAPDVPINPSTGEPYDPAIAAATSNERTETVKCDVVFSARNPKAVATAIGEELAGAVVLIAGIADRANMEGAEVAEVRGERYQLIGSRPDGIGGVQRFLAWGKAE